MFQVMSAAIEVFASKDTNAQVNQCWFFFTLLCMNIFLELLRNWRNCGSLYQRSVETKFSHSAILKRRMLNKTFKRKLTRKIFF